MDDAQKRYRASEARRILEEPLLREAFDEMERTAMEAMLAVPWWFSLRTSERRRRVLAERVAVIRAVRLELETIITEGKNPDARLHKVV